VPAATGGGAATASSAVGAGAAAVKGEFGGNTSRLRHQHSFRLPPGDAVLLRRPRTYLSRRRSRKVPRARAGRTEN
jgi:hypothetical protein